MSENSQIYSRNTFVETQKVGILIANLYTSMPATIICAVILIAVLWNVIPEMTFRVKLMTWGGLNIAYVLLRYIGITYFKNTFSFNKYQIWNRALIVSFVIAGVLFGSCGIFLIDCEQYEYILFLYFVAGGLVAGSVGSYHNNLPVYFAYSSTVFLIPTVSILMTKGDIALPMTILGLLYYIIMCLNTLRLNKDLTESLILKYDNMELVEKLNIEKQHTEKLNQELVEKNERLKEVTLIDPLTGVKNRRFLKDVFSPEANAFAKRYWHAISSRNQDATPLKNGYGILMIDIDFFKQVNDNYGHDAGDVVLQQFSSEIKKNVRDNDIVSRFGGEEFLVIVKDTNKNDLDMIADKIRRHIQFYNFQISEGQCIHITCSIGYVEFPSVATNPAILLFEDALTLSDKALYYAKHNGRNMSVRVICGDPLDVDVDKDAFVVRIGGATASDKKVGIGFQVTSKG